MTPEEHSEVCEKKFGQPFLEVHQFLDQYAKYLGARHRKILHNDLGLELVGIMFGPLALKAAYQHLVDDGV